MTTFSIVSRTNTITAVIVFWGLFSFGFLSAQGLRPVPETDQEGADLISAAQRVVSTYHQNAEANDARIRLVYFHPSDREPLADWEERLQRVMADIDQFYEEGFRRFNLQRRLPFDLDERAKYRFHLVKGSKNAGEYAYESGGIIEKEMRDALQGLIDFDREHVLVLCGLCREDDQGRFEFHSPYYGGGNAKKGLCFAADCRLLDPRLLTEKQKSIVYKEHYYERKEQSLALFNTWYIGGTAHELGHGIALPHNNGTPEEKKWAGVSLMGGGNHHYRSNLWGGKTPSFLSRSCALRLISSPLLTGSDRGRFEAASPQQLGEVKISKPDDSPGGIVVEGEVSSAIPAYAAIAYLWRADRKTDHSAISIPALFENDRFVISSRHSFRKGEYRLRLSVLYANSAETRQMHRVYFGVDGHLDEARMSSGKKITAIEQALQKGDRSQASLLFSELSGLADDEAQKAKVIKAILDPPMIEELSEVKEDSVSLSAVNWESATVGWGKPCRNHYDFNPPGIKNFYLQLGGVLYERGLYAHSNSNYTFDLDKKWKEFTARIGLRDGAAKIGSARFSVWGDGKQLFESEVLRSGESKKVKLSVEGVKILNLRAEGTEGHVNHSWAIWVNPQLGR